LVEAPDPLGMVPTSSLNISNVFEIIHRLRYKDGSTIMPLPPYAHPEDRELVESLDHGSTTNNDKV
jgi:hypothetical protein